MPPPFSIARRKLFAETLAGAAAAGLISTRAQYALAAEVPAEGTDGGSPHDFDFFIGDWTVKHRRLKRRLVGSDDWQEFDGTCRCWPLLGGLANVNERVAMRPDGTSSGLGLRAFDPQTRTWADWNLGAAAPHRIDAPIVGRFRDGVGVFLSDDTHEGVPIKVRGRFSDIAPGSAQWDQAFSTDGGKTWETNWIMRYTRIA